LVASRPIATTSRSDNEHFANTGPTGAHRETRKSVVDLSITLAIRGAVSATTAYAFGELDGTGAMDPLSVEVGGVHSN
jgi:hypothetical protein